MRASALALLTAYLGTGRDVVLPQLIVTPAQAERFEAAAAAAGAAYVAVVLDVAPETLLSRLHGRPRTPVNDVVARIIEERGGDDLVLEGRCQLLDLAPQHGWAVVDATEHDGTLAGLSEGVRFAQAAGLDLDRVFDAIAGGAAQSWQMDNRWQTMTQGRFDFGFAIDWMRKDLAIALEEAVAKGVDLSITRAVDGYYAEVQAMGGGRQDTSALIRHLPEAVA